MQTRHGEYTITALPVTAEDLKPLVALHQVCLPGRDPADESLLAEVVEALTGRDGLALAALAEDGTVVGYKLGYRTGNRREVFYSWLGGVHPFHRRKGLARALLRAQHAWAAAQGIRFVETHTWGDNAAMLILNLQEGFVAAGTLAGPDRAGVRVLLRKDLKRS